MQVTKTGPRPSDKYIPWYIVAFFAVFLSVDSAFLYIAASTHTGVVEDHTYQRGLHYNDTVAAAEAEAALGWQSELTLTAGKLELSLKDRVDNPLRAARVTADFFRPTQAGGDFTVTLNEVSDGLYSTDQIDAIPGQWEVRVFVEWKKNHYQLSERILVPRR